MKVRYRAQGTNPEAETKADAEKKRMLTGLGSPCLAHLIPLWVIWPGMAHMTTAEVLPHKSLVKKIS